MNFQNRLAKANDRGFFALLRMTRRKQIPLGMTTRKAKRKRKGTQRENRRGKGKGRSKGEGSLSLFQCFELVESAGPVCAEESRQASVCEDFSAGLAVGAVVGLVVGVADALY